jgi:predicted dehydrogenase
VSGRTLRVGVVGGGLIAQAVHLPNLARLGGRFAIAAIADPSQNVREALARRYPPARAYAEWRAMLDAEALDALVVCSPHATHAEVVSAGLELGLHAFVEKPLCISVEDAEAISARAKATGLVVQVGYMKRFHPAFDAFIAALPDAGGLRLVDVVTHDPWMAREPYVPWSRMVQAGDVPTPVLDAARESEREQVEHAVGSGDDEAVKAYSYTFLACLVHDINLVHGVLDALGVREPPEPVGSAAWANGEAASTTLRLPGGALWHCSWLLLPAQRGFRERVGLYFADGVHELELPVPYDVAAPVRHVVDGVVSEIAGDPFAAELEHFHDCIDRGTACRTPPEQAARDLALLRDLFVLDPIDSNAHQRGEGYVT